MPADFDLPPELRVNDSQILDDARLWRLIDPGQVHTNEAGKEVISESAFRTHELSVYMKGLADIETVQQMDAGARIAEFSVELVRSNGLIIATVEPLNPRINTSIALTTQDRGSKSRRRPR